MAENVNSVNSANNNSNGSNKGVRADCIVVRQGDTIENLAKRFGMKPSEFKSWVGLTKNTLPPNQIINLPVVRAIKSKGLYRLAVDNGMSPSEFYKLNGISNPDTYVVKDNEVFYVKKSNNTKIEQKQEVKQKSTQKTGSAQKAKPKAPVVQPAKSQPVQEENEFHSELGEHGIQAGKVISTLVENKRKWGSSFTPEELASKLFELADKYYGAVGKPDFDALIDEINPKNASAVIDAYTKLKDNEDKDSLIFTITHEIRSDKAKRKEAVMKIYDALAEEKGAPEEKRTEFEHELNAQFDSWGLVSTKKMDKIIKEIMENSIETEASSVATQGQVARKPLKADGRTIVTKPLKGSPKTLTASDLQRGAIASAKTEAVQKFKEYCKANGVKFNENLLDLAPLERIPAPSTKGNSLTAADSGLLPPTGKPNGKVIILNPGHGGYSSRTGYFDPGSYSFIKKGNGKYAPLLEYDKMKIYGDSTVEKLRAQGYSVVLTSGHAQTISDQGSISKIVNELKNGTRGKKYTDNDIMFISLHADSEPGQKGSGVCYDSRFANDRKLAQLMQSNLNEDSWVIAGLSERNWNVPKKGLQVLHQTETIPSVLLEVEYVNGSRCQNLDSSAYQVRFENKMIEAINEYFGF